MTLTLDTNALHEGPNAADVYGGGEVCPQRWMEGRKTAGHEYRESGELPRDMDNVECSANDDNILQNGDGGSDSGTAETWVRELIQPYL